MRQDFYTILEVRPSASADEIQRAYRLLALRYHPDRNKAPDAAARMAAINEAYEVLGDSARRQEYDARRFQTGPRADLSASILRAARDVVLRAGWAVIEENEKTLLLENGKHRIRVVFLHRLTDDLL